MNTTSTTDDAGSETAETRNSTTENGLPKTWADYNADHGNLENQNQTALMDMALAVLQRDGEIHTAQIHNAASSSENAVRVIEELEGLKSTNPGVNTISVIE